MIRFLLSLPILSLLAVVLVVPFRTPSFALVGLGGTPSGHPKSITVVPFSGLGLLREYPSLV